MEHRLVPVPALKPGPRHLAERGLGALDGQKAQQGSLRIYSKAVNAWRTVISRPKVFAALLTME
ncbi:hypothetical protein [Arthrobacter sp. ISL-95]|uniref:hypothetical protein n=1 Tax=Arthrobacter sp. ISL-95 TaxID=2819116 RepID=UPI001BE63E78|nr:hypothetical protein [Arthrobacter sp. ISL-95]MBT2587139.1 hypothetical protein [Arthrobacter sp. ISL-95]